MVNDFSLEKVYPRSETEFNLSRPVCKRYISKSNNITIQTPVDNESDIQNNTKSNSLSIDFQNVKHSIRFFLFYQFYQLRL